MEEINFMVLLSSESEYNVLYEFTVEEVTFLEKVFVKKL